MALGAVPRFPLAMLFFDNGLAFWGLAIAFSRKTPDQY
jgi:hypothetical protein